ncbi:MAG: VTT domain-containing protein, partial [Clostridia bacterium]|nr:VTT domain-containing protein [Clostridia bacterium]
MTKRARLKILTAVFLLLAFGGLAVMLLSGDTLRILKSVFSSNADAEEAQEMLFEIGWRGYVTLGLLSMLQVVFTFLPAEPAQVVSGITFGFWWGSLICFSGVVLGNTVIYVLYKIYGDRVTKYLKTKAEFDFDAARKSKRVALIVFILYFLPAIPYGIICLFAATLNIKYPKYIFLTAIGSLPSIFIGVGLGHMAMALSWVLSLIVFLVLVVLLLILFKNRNKLFQKLNAFMNKKHTELKKPSKFVWYTAMYGSRVYFGRKIKPKFHNEVGRVQGPAIVLCNHGSFIDFVYAGTILKKERPHFITARLYSYHKTLGKLIKKVGCIPKSMFSADLESTKQCMRVLASGRVLAMMPEARLSTVGKFEDIQPSTYKFIQRAGVPVYTIMIRGDYLANPKWGNGARKGSRVDITLAPLFKEGETATLSLAELQTRVEQALYYDEFAWLENNPQITYRKKTIAEGLENILYRCPVCGNMHCIQTQKDTVFCEKCGEKWQVNGRYAFTQEYPFKNFADWYAWQVDETRKEITENPAYCLQAKVELRHASVDGKSLTRHAGEGVCRLSKEGLHYTGTEDGKDIEKFFPLSQIYRLLFGAGQDFEIYEGKEIWFFVPED